MVAVCDLDLGRAQTLQKRFGVPAAFEQLGSMLQEVQPDVVHVLLPPELHAGAAETCLSAGSHVFVEKPFCLTVDDCRRVQAVADRNGLHIGVNHNVVYMPAYLELIDAIRTRRFGAIEHVQVMFTLPMPMLEKGPHSAWMFGGTDRLMLELGPHPTSMCTRLLGRPLSASAVASGELMLTNGVRFFRTWQTSFVCERGTAQTTMSVGAGYFTIYAHVLGEDAQALVDIRRNTVQIIDKTPYLRLDDMVNAGRNSLRLARRSLSNFKTYSLGAVTFGPRYDQQTFSFSSSVPAFYRALAAGRPPRIDGVEGTAVVEACQMALHSALSSTEKKEERVVAV